MNLPDDNALLRGGPFGDPDAARVEVKNSKYFVEMGDVAPQLRMSSQDFSKRLIVGRKGSGKTFYLRSLWQDAKPKADSIVMDDSNPIPEAVLLQITSSIPIDRSPTTWHQIWRRATFSFMASLFHCKHRQKTESFAEKLVMKIPNQEFLTYFNVIFDVPFTEKTPSQYVASFAQKYDRRTKDMEAFLSDRRWAEFENVISSAIGHIPPIFLFVDALDNQQEWTPQLWHDSQHGLFSFVFETLGEGALGNRLHIISTIRDPVYRSLLKTVHGSRIKGDSHIKVLDWRMRDAEFFIRKKIEKLPTRLFAHKADTKTLESLVGFAEVENIKRGLREPVMQYVLRHTRALPRDIVILGNRIVKEIDECRALDRSFRNGHLRKCVEEVSKLFAYESIALCATEMLLRDEANRYKRLLRLTDDALQAMHAPLMSFIETFVCGIGNEIFSEDDLNKQLAIAYETDPYGKSDFLSSRVDNILWRNGMIAYEDLRGREQSKWIFQWYSEAEQDKLPRKKGRFAFHPSLIDLYNIQNGGQEIVY